MKLTIAIMAHNEESAIAGTLEQLFLQSVFSGASIVDHVAVYVIANGCSDRTAEVSAMALSCQRPVGRVSWEVVSLQCAGKSNAWNVFVHDVMPADTDYVAVMDADIGFVGRESVASCLGVLEKASEAVIATPRLVKQFSGSRKSWFGALLVRAFSGTADGCAHAIAGAFYCARPSALRSIVMPRNIVVEDGYLRAMVLTSALTEPERLERIQVATEAAVLHVPYTRLSDIYRYQVRQAKGTAINMLVYKEISRLPGIMQERMTWIRERNAEQPNWVAGLVRRHGEVARNMIPRGYVLRRLSVARTARGLAKLKRIILLPALLYDVVIAYAADSQLRSAAKEAQWDRIRD